MVSSRSDPSRVAVKTGRSTLAVVERADATEAGIAPGARLSSTQRARLVEAGHRLRAFDAAAGLLARRALSRHAVLDALARRGHTPEASTHAVARLAAAGLLDDHAFARGIVRACLARRPAGATLLMARLESRGVPRDIAREVLRESLQGQDPDAAALELAQRRMRSLKGLDPRAAARRLYGALARRGFEPGVCARAVRLVVGQAAGADE